jgi:hypothetical protein
MAVFFEVLIAVNIKDIGVLAGTDETVAHFSLHLELNILAGFGAFDGELLLDLPKRAQNTP